MNIEKLTVKSQEAVKNSIDIAIKSGHQIVTPLHLLVAIMEMNEKVVVI